MVRARPTRAQRTRANATAAAVLAGLGLAWWAGGGLANLAAGRGWTPPHPRLQLRLAAGHLWQVVHAPTDRHAWLLWGALVAAGWALLVVRPLARRATADPRRDGLATAGQLRPLLSASACRRAARWTRPDLGWRDRRRVPLTAVGWSVGRLGRRGPQLWANPELRAKVVARTGWGKTARLLIPAVRRAPGAALVGTTAADLFQCTVRARQATGRPVWVLDFTDPAYRVAAGYDRLTWDPVAGCHDLSVALRRGRALAYGADDGSRTDDLDGFFRDAATHVLAAWLHAADLSGQGMAAVLRWQRDLRDTQPHTIIDAHAAAESAARTALLKHLDERAMRTTSGVERFLANALYPFGTRDGADFAAGGGPTPADLVASGATVYLLASAATSTTVAPLLTVFADEWVHAVRSHALALPAGRLGPWAALVLDELRGLVPIPSLPDVAAQYRKLGLALVYGVQNDGQLDELYGPRAAELSQSTQLAIYGGYDPSAAAELIDRSGQVPVPSVGVGGGLLAPDYNEGEQYRPRIDAADLQALRDGQSVMVLAGAPLFFGWHPSYRDNRRLRRQVVAEERAVRAAVAAAQAVAEAERTAAWQLAQATYTGPRGDR